MASAANQPEPGHTPKKFYLEFDLAVKVKPVSSSPLGYQVLPKRMCVDDLPADLQLKVDSNSVLARTSLATYLEGKNVAVLDAERFDGPGYREYLNGKREKWAGAVSGLTDHEAIHDRFWQIFLGPTTEVCPPPETAPSPASGSGHGTAAFSLDYPYAALILRSPAMDCTILDRGSEASFIKDLSSFSDVWPGRQAGERCMWKEVQYVMHYLNAWCFEEDDRPFNIVAPRQGVRDCGTNTSLRVLLSCGSMSSDELYSRLFEWLSHGEMGLPQMKKIAMLMWFFEGHLQQLSHPNQATIRSQSTLFPLWSRHGPLSRPIASLSLAALQASAVQRPLEGSTLQGMLQYVPRNMFACMGEYKKLAKLWEAGNPTDLVEMLRIDGSPALRGDLADENTSWSVLRFGHGFGCDIHHREVCLPYVAIGGFQCVPFDVFLFRSAALLVRCCVRTSRLGREDFQWLLGKIMETGQENSLELVQLLGADLNVWRHYQREYVSYWAGL